MLHCPLCDTDVERRWENGPVRCKCGAVRVMARESTTEAEVILRDEVRRDVTAELAQVKAKMLALGKPWTPDAEEGARHLLKEVEVVQTHLRLSVKGAFGGRLFLSRNFDLSDEVPKEGREAAFAEFMNLVRLRKIQEVMTG